MTRDEAIKWLQGIEKRYFHGGDEVYDKKRREAVRMAIEALENECMNVQCADMRGKDDDN